MHKCLDPEDQPFAVHKDANVVIDTPSLISDRVEMISAPAPAIAWPFDIVSCTYPDATDTLIEACKTGNTAVLESLFIAGIDINSVRDVATGNTLMHCAILSHNYEVISMLAHYGHSLTAKNAAGQSVLACAIGQCDAKAANTLLSSAAAPRLDPNSSDFMLLCALLHRTYNQAEAAVLHAHLLWNATRMPPHWDHCILCDTGRGDTHGGMMVLYPPGTPSWSNIAPTCHLFRVERDSDEFQQLEARFTEHMADAARVVNIHRVQYSVQARIPYETARIQSIAHGITAQEIRNLFHTPTQARIKEVIEEGLDPSAVTRRHTMGPAIYLTPHGLKAASYCTKPLYDLPPGPPYRPEKMRFVLVCSILADRQHFVPLSDAFKHTARRPPVGVDTLVGEFTGPGQTEYAVFRADRVRIDYMISYMVSDKFEQLVKAVIAPASSHTPHTAQTRSPRSRTQSPLSVATSHAAGKRLCDQAQYTPTPATPPVSPQETIAHLH